MSSRIFCILYSMGPPRFEYAVDDYPLGPRTIYKVGGPARLALLPRTRDEVVEAYLWMQGQEGPKLILGAGSNVLVTDAGFPGTVLFTDALARMESLGEDRYTVEGGIVLDALVQQVLIPNNYEGTGGLTGIPGTVGGAIFMNAGTVNGTICQLMESVEVLAADTISEIPMAASLYSYRGQDFCPPGSLILGGVFHFEDAKADQGAIYDHYIARRLEKQPQGKCCGSVFKNPEDDHAGRLIEACDLKGTRRGGAVISPLHANFIVNDEGATADDILWLIALCKRTVQERFGISLKEEVKIIAV